ncbi:hypothetical protein SEA_BENCZKOWSKI14_63 [Gordonia phage Benczkowski14]|uniref:Uncharacterized protein n=5 Tax=Demosthenesvirus katyusha TaxID=1982108 RepID=A0A345MCA1_9CAUD|nr:hypothetical protein BH765_gp62 [Gordonia phage Kvothe]YP_009603337.1 hypothetical protein FDH67_gp63 [Gordonia phage Katyusha]AMS03773.1 hypothetical protein SEA_BENCZKOWSKI14_63 [Gordonia phage Benczkowski14]AXH68122.1 hypothetical protein SEA_TEATEALATTE_64 [Gordonia phage Teatealatte]QBP29620.1 hypothetical protein SEA_TREDGE_63 [Gordonia phage Tredge]UJD20699.1 hypothetical protein SEA_NIAGARA_63 [Gordonia phage Niagara]AMS03456.1 hypothetical protein SEA_KATYUSHA_63 [Gordonia phage K
MAGRTRTSDVLSPSRRAWVSIKTFMATLYIDTRKSERDSAEDGAEVTLILSDKATTIKLMLTAMREDELTAFQRMITISCENAREVVRERDRIAYRALEEGSTKYPRCFRPQSAVLVREGDEFDLPYLKRDWSGDSGAILEQQATAFSSAPVGVFVAKEEMIGVNRNEGQEAQE